MFPAILLGVISGVVGFSPLVIALIMTKRNPQVGNVAPMMKLVIGLFASFVILLVTAISFAVFDKPNALAFVLSEAIALTVSAVGFGIWSQIRK